MKDFEPVEKKCYRRILQGFYDKNKKSCRGRLFFPLKKASQKN